MGHHRWTSPRRFLAVIAARLHPRLSPGETKGAAAGSAPATGQTADTTTRSTGDGERRLKR
jgi:hypothetical protein